MPTEHEPHDAVATSPAGELERGEAAGPDVLAEQDAEAQQLAAEFLRKVVRLRGVRIDRADFLRQELRKLGVDDATLTTAATTTPVQAGITVEQLDDLAKATINLETRKSAAMSFASGLPGGFAMFAAIPADITQYYVHAFRVMQKLAFLYGWKDFISDLDEVDDETLAKLTMFLGVMMGVGGASASLTSFAAQVARPALQKQIAQQSLTKNAWYLPMKQTLKLIGVKLTKDSFAKSVSKVVPVAGGVISGGMTLVSLQGQAKRLQQHLRQLPPPGVDAQAYLAAVKRADEDDTSNRLDSAKDAVEGAASEVKDRAGDVASSARGAAGHLASRAQGLLSKRPRRGNAAEQPDATD